MIQIDDDVPPMRKNENLTIREPLTFAQECDICYIIGDWYLKYKDRLVDYKTQTHRLGHAIYDLKNMICKIEVDDEE